jgi:hypothetical protein
MKKFKSHKMYSKTGSVKTVKTMKEHLDLKKKGWGHKKSK